MDWILESERLGFRFLDQEDAAPLKEILGDPQVMYAWEHSFTQKEIQEWLWENQRRYQEDGYSYFAAVLKNSGKLAGVIGPLVEKLETGNKTGIGYILKKEYWGKGLCVEGAKACMEYAFSILEAEEVIAEIRPENIPSRRVAERLGMKVTGQLVKTYRGKKMPHLIYSRSREE